MAIIYKIKDTDGNTHDIVDSKVTSVDNHYTPAEDTSAAINASNGTSTNITGTSGKINVVTGVKRDAKGHIIGVTSANIYSTDNNTDTHYTSKNIVGTAASSTSNGEVTGNGVYLNHLEESAVKSTHKITGAGSVSVTSDSSGNITITGTTGSSSDTKNTAGSNDTSSKIYLIGAKTQSDNPQTYSHSSVYVNIDHSIHALKFYQDSDERLKTFTEDYDINLDDIKNIKTGRFYWNSDESQEINSGVSAQTVEAYFPELVIENENGIKSVNYDGLAVVAIAAIKKLTERIEQLEDIIRNK